MFRMISVRGNMVKLMLRKEPLFNQRYKGEKEIVPFPSSESRLFNSGSNDTR